MEAELRAMLTDGNAADMAQALTPDLLDSVLGQLAVRRWALLDREAAAEWMAGVATTTAADAGSVIYGWLKEDRGGMLEYIDSLQPGRWRDDVIQAAANDAFVVKESAQAISLLLKLPSAAPRRDEMLGWAATQWARNDPASAAEWAGRIEDDDLQQSMLRSIAIGYAWKDPQAAASWLADVATSPESMQPAAASIASIWARQAPEAAASWVAQLPPGDVQQTAAAALVMAWTYRDSSRAQAWVDALPPGNLRGEAAQALATAMARLNGRATAAE